MYKQLLILLISLSLFSRAWADEAQIDGIYYDLDRGAMTAKVICSYDKEPAETYIGSVVIPMTVTEKTGDKETFTVTGINDNAFAYCTGLTEVTVPATVTSIGSSAFSGCTSLKSARLSDNIISIGAYAFAECASLQEINCPASLTDIQGGTFFGCVSLNAFVIAASVVNIDYSAFEKCIELKHLTIADGTEVLASVTAFSEMALNSLYLGRPVDNCSFNVSALETLSIGSAVEAIPDGIFSGASNLSSLTIADGVKDIGSWAFRGCTSLQTLSLPASVDSIGWGTFSECSALTSINLNRVIRFGNGAFSGCIALKSFSLPEGMTEVPDDFLSNCTNLESVTLPSTITSIGSAAFRGCPLTSVDIPDGVTCIKRMAFGECKSMDNLSFGSNMRYIEDGAFYECRKINEIRYRGTLADWLKISFGSASRPYPEDTNPLSYTETFKIYDADKGDYMPLTDIVIPEGTDSIPALSLCGCKGFASLEMPQTVEYIGEDAFSWSGLKKAVIRAKSIREFAFCYTKLNEVTLGEDLEEIQSRAFSSSTIQTLRFEGDMKKWCAINRQSLMSCTDLYIDGTLQVNVTIPATVEEIKDYSFYGCMGIESVAITSSTKKIGSNAFASCPNLKSFVWSNTSSAKAKSASVASAKGFEIGSEAFYNDTSLSDISLPEDITSIGSYAFRSTAWEANLPEGLAYIGNILYIYKGTIPGNSHLVVREGTIGICGNAFNDYSDGGFTISLPSSLTTLADDVFSGNGGLKGISLPEGLVSIGFGTFHGCMNLKEIQLPGNLKEIGGSAFSGSGLTAITIPSSVTSLSSSAFSNCSDLRSLSFADGADMLYMQIAGSEFGYGSPVQSIYLGRNVKAIMNEQDSEGRTLYIGDWNLKELTIGPNIDNMGKLCFMNCGEGLADITVLRDVPPVCENYDVFPYGTYQDAKLHVPSGSENAYSQAVVWKDFLNIIGEELTGIDHVVSGVMESATELHYDLSGRQVSPETPGIHVVRKQNGHSYKQFVK